jgi:FixJ family two-component response regulator
MNEKIRSRTQTLSDEQVRDIWRAADANTNRKQVAEKFGVALSTVNRIFRGMARFDATLELRKARNLKKETQ